MAENNPNGANGVTSDPREQICWDVYVLNLSKGIDNAYKAAIEAKYSEDSARNVTMRDWFKERLGKLKQKEILSKAEKILDKTLSLEAVTEEGKVDNQLLAIQNKTAQFVAETVGKNDGYSKRTELTGRDGEKLSIQFADVFKK